MKDRQHNGQNQKGQKDKQRSTKHTYKTKDRVTRTSLKGGGELMRSGRGNYLFCGKVSFLTAPHYQFRCVGQGVKKIYLYPLLQSQWDVINEITKSRII